MDSGSFVGYLIPSQKWLIPDSTSKNFWDSGIRCPFKLETEWSSVGAARKVSPNWSQETMACHSFSCFSIVWGQG